jgi:drug/metabolite transporter (DMT)-like permease
MLHYLGIIFAFIALVSWGFGDFFIQKTVRALNSWKALFFICTTAMVGLFPFIRGSLSSLGARDFWLLGLAGTAMLVAAIFDFEALRKGKIAVVEPILGLELPIVVALGVTLGGDFLTSLQILLITLVCIGIILAATKRRPRESIRREIVEKGVILASLAAITMALTNFLVGVSSQGVSPLITIWFAHSLLAVVSGLVLLLRGDLKNIFADFKKYPGPIIGQSIFDNLAWVAFAFAATLIPISIATTISESYIALAVFLGLFANKEKLRCHQLIGAFFAIAGIITLSYFS